MKSVIPFIIMALCISSYFFYVKPTMGVIAQKQAKLDEYNTVINKVKEIKVKREELETRYQNITEEDLNKLDKMIPAQFVSEYFVNDLNSVSSRYGMKISEMNITVPMNEEGTQDDTQAATEKLKVITAKFTLSGRFDQLLSFLKDLESSLRIIDVVNLSIGGKDASSKDNQILSYSFEVKTYSLK